MLAEAKWLSAYFRWAKRINFTALIDFLRKFPRNEAWRVWGVSVVPSSDAFQFLHRSINRAVVHNASIKRFYNFKFFPAHSTCKLNLLLHRSPCVGRGRKSVEVSRKIKFNEHRFYLRVDSIFTATADCTTVARGLTFIMMDTTITT